jgi:hypothetical protein
VKLNPPAVVFDPLTPPSGESESPGGNVPPTTDHEYGAVPPDAPSAIAA